MRRSIATASTTVGNIKVGYQTPSGVNAYVPLSELADISLDTGASYIYHERNERYIPIKFSVRGRDLGSTVAEAQQRIARDVKLPTGYRIEWAGEFEELQQAKSRLALVVPISLLLILVLLYGLFNSFRDSLLALAGIPFSIGGRRPRALCHRIGFQHFGGDRLRVAVRRVGHERHPDHHLLQSGERGGGVSPVDAMFQAAEQLMRPMLMTALSACIGLLPAAISTGIGSQVQRPLGDRRGRRHVHRTDHAARGRAGAADLVRASGKPGSAVGGRRGRAGERMRRRWRRR